MHIRKWYAAVFPISVYKLCHAWSCVVNWTWENNFSMDVIAIIYIPYYSTVNPPHYNNFQQQHIHPIPSAPHHLFHNMNIHQPPTDYDNIDIDINNFIA